MEQLFDKCGKCGKLKRMPINDIRKLISNADDMIIESEKEFKELSILFSEGSNLHHRRFHLG